MSTTSYISYSTSFIIDKLFDLCRLKSLYATSVPAQSGATQESLHAMTSNERDFFNVALKKSASDVYDIISQDTKIVETPFTFNANGQIYFNLLIHGSWDRNQSFGLNTAMEEALVSNVLMQWYKLRMIPQYQAEADSYTNTAQNLKNILNRRIAPVEKTYRYL